MIETLEQLAHYVQRSIPEPRALAAITPHERNDYVSFRWHSTQFVIKKTLQVFEVKGQCLFVTGSSMLMQSAFIKIEHTERILSTIVDCMRQVQTLVGNGDDVALGLKLLSGIKHSLRKLADSDGKQADREQTSPSSDSLATQHACAG